MKEYLRDLRLDKFFENPYNILYGNEYEYVTNSTGYKELVRNEKEKSVLTVAIPGLSKEDVELEVKEEGTLSLRFLKQTDFFKTQHKSWTLSDDVDIENVSAECKDGILTVVLPKTKRLPSTRKVEIL